MKNFTKFFLLLFAAVSFNVVSNAQTTGTVFRDYNGNGTRQTSAPNEPLVAGVIVTAYDANDVVVASYKTTNTSAPNFTIPTSGTSYNGTLGSNTGFVANATAVRLEFVIPNNGTSICSVNGNYDFSGIGGVTYGSNVRFLASSGAARANNNFALNYPADLVTSGYNPYLFVPTWLNGDPLGGGTAGSGRGFAGFPYNSSGTTASSRNLVASQVGCVYGNAYSKQADKIFLGAYIRRFSGLGPANSSGAIYLVNNLTSGTIAASAFYDMDANGYATRYNGVLAYGAGTSFTLSGTFPNKTIAYSGANDPNSGLPIGLGVIGANSGSATTSRNLSASTGTRANDPAAWGQVGRVGLGDIEISDDGKYLFVVNLYDRKLYRLTLNSPTNPTGVTAVTSYALPTPPLRSTKSALFANTYTGANNSTDFYTGVKGYQRPFGLKYYKGKVFVGAVTTGENGGTSTNDNNAGNPEYTDLWAYVWQFDADASTPAFNTTPLLQEPQNYYRGTNGDGADESWKPWTNTHATFFPNYNYYFAQPMFSGIEFDNDGTMIIGLRDRFGDQIGCANSSLDGGIPPAVGGVIQANGVGLGHILRAYFNPVTCQYEMESNGKEGVSSSKAATAGAGMGRGPGNGQFYYQANIFTGGSYANGGGACAATVPCATYHLNLAEGSLVMLPGDDKIASTQVDPTTTWENGITWYNNTTGANPRDYQLSVGQTIDAFGKANGLGDLEMITPLSPIEIGNRIWNDANGNGIQDAGEAGIANVILELVDGSGNAVDNDPGTAGVQPTFVTTDANGNWYITSATGTDATGINYGVALLPNTNYSVRLTTSGTGNDWDPTANGGAGGPRAGGDLVNYQLTITDKVGTGAVDLSDNDAAIVSSIPQVNITTGDYGENNHNIDFGFKQLASIGDKVWRDDDKDGIQDTGEPGVAGVSVTLYQNGADGLPGTADDVLVGTTITDAYGNYLFDNLAASTNAATSYNVGFTLPTNYQFTTQTNTQVTGTSDVTNTTTTSGGSTAANGSDASTTTGRTGSFWLAAGEAERGTDAGLIFAQPTTNSLGDKVWFDTDGDGVQDANEAGVSGVTVTLYNNAGVVIATTVTDANGNYIFTGLADGNYRVGFTLPVGFNFTTRGADNTSGGAGDSNTDSDVNTAAGVNFGKTDVINLDAASAISSGVNYTNVDAGLVQTAATTASLGDKVWNDLNSNGIQDAGEPGVAGVTVNLYRDSNNDGVISGSEASTPYATTVTDAFGNYIFNNLPASSGANGFYQVGFVAPSGYTLTTANAGSDETKDSDANIGTGLTGNYFLKAGERNLTVDAGLVQTSPAGTARLGDKVWFDTNSNGTQDVGETGVAGVTVTLYNNIGTAIATTTTDANGNYQFVNLAAGDYSVGFSNLPAGYSFTPVWSSNDVIATNSDANPGTGRTGTINLTAGESEQDVDAGLIAGVSSGLGSLGNKVWWDIVTANNIQDAGEPGVPGVTVNLDYDINGDGDFADAGEIGYKSTTTNALGEYLFTGLSAGRYQVGFSTLPTGSNTVTQNSGTNDAIDSDGSAVVGATGSSVSTTGVYNLAAGEDNLTVDLGLINTAKGSLGNRVWFDNGVGGGTANDGIQNGTESGVAGVMVTLVNAAGQPVNRAGTVLGAGASLITTTTDVNGYYAFGDLTAGASFAVKFSNVPAGFDFTTKAGAGEGDDSRSDPNLTSGLTPALTIVANTFNSTLDAGITSPRAALGNYVWLDTDGDGIQDFDGTEPGVAGVTVTLYRPGFGLDGIAGNGDDALPVASMITDQNGQYLFSNLVAGTYEVEFSTIPSGISFTKQNTPGDNSDNTNSDAVPLPGNTSVARTAGITLSASEVDLTVDAGLFKPRAVIGNYVWADSDNDGIQDANEIPASGILVSLIDGGGNVVAVAVTDANGGYLFPNVAPGTYSMSFTNLPTGTSFTTPNQTAGGGNDNNDSDVIGTTVTGIVVTTTTVNLSFDAGLVGFIALPARLEFTAVKQGNSAKLSWKVSYEENVARYELEHSADGINYRSISNQNRNGSSEYQYLDAQPASGINYYRVRIVDISGQITYSEVRTVLFGKGGQILVFPNPVKTGGQVNIQLPESWQNRKITIEVMNQLGQVISTQSRQQASQVETVDANRFSDGSYLLRISSANGEVETRKIIVNRK